MEIQEIKQRLTLAPPMSIPIHNILSGYPDSSF